ncbi:MAG TPA: hypothetical protein VMX13_05070 [Sedimentisphaerales bacterium]|nr:hypothetical protein [Sedimentisphaerales bacterium]
MDNLCLELFNARVDRLDRCKLAKRMDEDPNYRLDHSQMIKREWISVHGITEDDIDAFVLNARLLIQDNDGFSIRCLAESVYSGDDVPEKVKEQFSEYRRKWRDYRESSSPFKHYEDDRHFTNGELFGVVLYGGLAHSNRDKVVCFYAIRKQGLVSSIMCARFLSTLRIFLGVVRGIREVNNKVLKDYNAKKEAKSAGD